MGHAPVRTVVWCMENIIETLNIQNPITSRLHAMTLTSQSNGVAQAVRGTPVHLSYPDSPECHTLDRANGQRYAYLLPLSGSVEGDRLAERPDP